MPTCLLSFLSDDVSVSAIEAQLAGRTLQEHFREQAELLDLRFAEQDERWDVRFGRLEEDINVLKADVSTLKRDMVIVREGIGMLLKKHG